jgi:hypothetical protein
MKRTAQIRVAVAGLLLYATVRAPSMHLGRVGLTPLDVAALGAIAVVLVGWARGSVDSQQLTGGSGTSAFLLLGPALIVFAAAVLAARLLAPTLRPQARGPAGDRAATGSLAGAKPGHAAISDVPRGDLGPLFTVTYRSTLLAARRTKRASPCRRRSSSPKTCRSSFPCCTARRSTGIRARRPPCSACQERPRRNDVCPVPAERVTARGLARRLRLERLPRRRGVTPPDVALRTTGLPVGRQFTLPVTAR